MKKLKKIYFSYKQGNKRVVRALCLLYNIYHWVDHPINMYLNHFVADRNIRLTALSELALVIPHCRTDQFAAGRFCLLRRLWNLLPSACLVVAPWPLLRALWTCTYWGLSFIFFIFISATFLCSIACLVSLLWCRSDL